MIFLFFNVVVNSVAKEKKTKVVNSETQVILYLIHFIEKDTNFFLYFYRTNNNIVKNMCVSANFSNCQ